MADQFLADLMGDWGDPEETPVPPPPPVQMIEVSGPAGDPIQVPAPKVVPEQPQFPVLYHKGKGGALYQWKIWTEGATIYTEYGITGGKKQISTKIAQPKNEGRANATTPEEQALSEAKSMWTHKVERKYREDFNEAQETVFLPMLAHKYDEKKKKKVTFPVDVQPKLDGVRCIAYWDESGVRLMSRQGKEYSVPRHIADQLEEILPKDAILDGELYVHGETLQTISSWVKRLRPETAKVEYHVYDVPQWEGQDDQPWSVRRAWLAAFAGLLNDDTPNVQIVETEQADTEADVFTFQRAFVADGYEGAIVRDHAGIYLWGYRSDALLKVKTFQDDEFEVTSFKYGDPGTKEEPCVIWICKIKNGEEFNCRPKGSLESRMITPEQAKKFVGRKLTVRFFDLTEDSIPRFPVGVAFRLDEDLP